jgi:hypothetical protein
MTIRTSKIANDSSSRDVTELLQKWQPGDAVDRLLQLRR